MRLSGSNYYINNPIVLFYSILYIFVFIGDEKQFSECNYGDVENADCSRNYAAVACYSGSKLTGKEIGSFFCFISHHWKRSNRLLTSHGTYESLKG